jgi:hypothetical protein
MEMGNLLNSRRDRWIDKRYRSSLHLSHMGILSDLKTIGIGVRPQDGPSFDDWTMIRYLSVSSISIPTLFWKHTSMVSPRYSKWYRSYSGSCAAKPGQLFVPQGYPPYSWSYFYGIGKTGDPCNANIFPDLAVLWTWRNDRSHYTHLTPKLRVAYTYFSIFLRPLLIPPSLTNNGVFI